MPLLSNNGTQNITMSKSERKKLEKSRTRENCLKNCLKKLKKEEKLELSTQNWRNNSPQADSWLASAADQDKAEDVMATSLKEMNCNSISRKSRRKNDYKFIIKYSILYRFFNNSFKYNKKNFINLYREKMKTHSGILI
jgi:hypothetical protein